MSRATTIFLVLAAIVLTAFVAKTSRWRSSYERLARPGAALFDLNTDAIHGVKIKNGDQSFLLKKTSGIWNLASDVQDAASPETIQKLFQTARNTIILDKIDDTEIKDTKGLSDYGVHKSNLQLDFLGDALPSLLFGKTTADGTRTYVAFENSKTVYLIPSDLVKAITLPASDFRDTRLAAIDPKSINKFTINRGSLSLDVVRKGDQWLITKPQQIPADTAAVEALITKILKTRLTALIAAAPTDSSSINQDTAEIKFFTEGETQVTSIAIGTPSPDGGFFAKLQPRNIQCRVPSQLLDLLTPNLDALRDKALARINPDFIDLIRISTPAAKRNIKRLGATWGSNDEAVEKWITALRETKAVSYKPATPTELKNYGLDEPSLTIVFLAVVSENTPESLAGEQVVAELRFGKLTEEGLIGVHTAGSPEIALAPVSLLESAKLILRD